MRGKQYRQTITEESEILTFGKFKNCTVQHVLRTDPKYLTWLNDEKIVKFGSVLLDLIFDRALDELEDEIGTYNHNYSSYYDDE